MHRPGHGAPLLLELDLTVPLADPPPQQGLAKALSRGAPALREVLLRLHRAARDPRVGGLIVRAGGPAQRLATAQELRDLRGDRRLSGSCGGPVPRLRSITAA